MKDKKEKMDLASKSPETANPFQMMQQFTKNMGKLFEDFQGFRFPNFVRSDFEPLRVELEAFDWMPEIEVQQNNGQLIVKADLPGLTKDDVKVELTDKALTISGERKEEKEEKREGYYRTERSYGSFYRQVPLPEGAKIDAATAEFHNGVLEVTMPAKKEEKTTRKLEIKVPSEPKSAKAAA
jgi:HSP20 family protein